MEDTSPSDYLPLSATDFQLLLALAAGDLHGYAIGKAVKEASDGRVRIGLGSLYRIIARLLNAGIVEECDSEHDLSGKDSKRRRYRLSELGSEVLRAEVCRLSDAVDLARSSRLFADGKI